MKQYQNTNLISVTIVTFHVFPFVICKSADRYYRACRLIFLCLPFTISMLVIHYLYACHSLSLCLSFYISMPVVLYLYAWCQLRTKHPRDNDGSFALQ